jgi:hypothetical protein
MARFYRRGISKMKFLPAVAGASPTRGEINAGVDISPQVAEINGFALTNSPIATPDLSTAFNTQIPGSDEAADSSVTMYDDNASATIRTAMAKGTAGYMVLFPYGDVATKRLEVYAVTSTGVNDQWTTAAEAAKYVASFAVTATPNQTGTTP